MQNIYCRATTNFLIVPCLPNNLTILRYKVSIKFPNYTQTDKNRKNADSICGWWKIMLAEPNLPSLSGKEMTGGVDVKYIKKIINF
jgi:hypothetical protein